MFTIQRVVWTNWSLIWGPWFSLECLPLLTYGLNPYVFSETDSAIKWAVVIPGLPTAPVPGWNWGGGFSDLEPEGKWFSVGIKGGLWPSWNCAPASSICLLDMQVLNLTFGFLAASAFLVLVFYLECIFDSISNGQLIKFLGTSSHVASWDLVPHLK